MKRKRGKGTGRGKRTGRVEEEKAWGKVGPIDCDKVGDREGRRISAEDSGDFSSFVSFHDR